MVPIHLLMHKICFKQTIATNQINLAGIYGHFEMLYQLFFYVPPWCSGYHYWTTSFYKAWTQVLRRFKSCSWCVGDCDGEDLWQWSRLEIRLNTFRRSTIPQKQFIIIKYCGNIYYNTNISQMVVRTNIY